MIVKKLFNLPVAVTGASGFVGRQLVFDLLASGAKVHAATLTRPFEVLGQRSFRLNLMTQEIEDGFLKGAKVLVHLAGPAHTHGVNNNVYRKVLVDAGRWLFERAVQAGVDRVVLVSSCKAGYEFGCDIDETAAAHPETMYGQYKLAQEQLFGELAQKHSVELVILRPSLIYGVGVAGNLKTWLRRAQSRFVPPLPVGGLRSMVSVGDMSAAVQLACVEKNATGRIYYVADGQRYLVHEVDRAIRATCGAHLLGPGSLKLWRSAALLGNVGMLCGIDIGIDSARLGALRGDSSCSATRLRRELNWKPRDNFYDMLPQMLANLQE